jgi:hypothetical protein
MYYINLFATRFHRFVAYLWLVEWDWPIMSEPGTTPRRGAATVNRTRLGDEPGKTQADDFAVLHR